MAQGREDPSPPSCRATSDHATRHAAGLLAALGVRAPADPVAADHPALAWRRAGLFAVTGRSDGPPLVCPVPLTAAADGALAALRQLAPAAPLPANGALLLGERARLLGLVRQGATSANGSCRLLRTQDGRIALNLPRADDWEMLPALLGDVACDWREVEDLVGTFRTRRLVTAGRLLGVAVAADRAGPIPAAPFTIRQYAAPGPRVRRAPLVVDLSSLWAGPLAASLLGMAGADVVKVESLHRPDGARTGNAPFFDLLNAGKASVAFDFSDPGQLVRLRALVDRADIVIEGTRPRALAQLGIMAEAVARRGATWVSITGHGRAGGSGRGVGFGDDAAVAGGQATSMRRGWGEPLFAGDAIADPLAGITAALAAWASWQAGGGRLVSVPLSRVVAQARGLGCAGAALPAWQALAEQDDAPLYPLRVAAA